MKKSILKISAIIATLAFASSAFAVTSLTTSTTIGGGTFAPSKNVTIKVISSTSSYAATSQNSQGSKQYGTVGGTGVTGDPTKILTATSITDGPTAPGDALSLPSGVTWQ